MRIKDYPLDDHPNAETSVGAQRLTARRYERPRILSREHLETVAGVCAPEPPAKGSPGMCAGPISS
jgi:hypothetical protein